MSGKRNVLRSVSCGITSKNLLLLFFLQLDIQIITTLTYLVILYIGFGLLIAFLAEKYISPVYHEVTEQGWHIKYNFANQVVTAFLMFWFAAFFFLLAYQSKELLEYRQALKILMGAVTAVCIGYAIEKKTKSVYVYFDEKSSTINHGNLKIPVADIDHFEFLTVNSSGDGADSIFLFIHLKNGRKEKLNASVSSVSGKGVMYLKAIKILAEQTGLPYIQNHE